MSMHRDTKTGDAPRHWRWRGFITDYYTAEPSSTAVNGHHSNGKGNHSNGNGTHSNGNRNGKWAPSDGAAESTVNSHDSDKPAFLLVHGFGAFGEQWRRQVRALTDAGYQVGFDIFVLG